jgi:thiol peroxidase
MDEKRTVTFNGTPLTLIGHEVKINEQAPDCEVTANDLSPVKLSSFRGKVCIISSVPSLDTPVCDIETRRFNQEAAKLGPDVEILTISMDLPFAQARWCGGAGIDRVKTFSDYKNADFGKNYGVLIEELHLLARVVFVVDQEGVIRYIQQVHELANEPNYDEVLQAVSSLVKVSA